VRVRARKSLSRSRRPCEWEEPVVGIEEWVGPVVTIEVQ
jgi:hypothetical protein